MTSKIDIIISDVELEVEIEVTPPEPENGIQGGYDIIAVNAIGKDIWPLIGEYPVIEELIVAAIEAKGR